MSQEDTKLKKRVWGWMAFDWATQPFYTLGLTFIFGPYFAVSAAEFFMSSGLDEQTAKAQAQSVWTLGQFVAGFFVAIFGVIIGAYADTTGKRMPWMVLFSILFVICSTLLWQMLPDGSTMWFALIVFSIAFIAAEMALVFTNALLPSLGDAEKIGKISGTGAAIGYWGGFVALIVMFVFFAEMDAGKTILGSDPAFGLDGQNREGTRFVGPLIAIWYIIFMIPFFLWVREESAPNRTGGMTKALSDLWRSLKEVTKRPSLAAFLGSSMFYRDALNGLYAFGGVYAAFVLDWGIMQLGTFGILGAITAAIATQVSGRFDQKYGPRPVIMFHIIILTMVSTIIIGMSRETFFGISLASGSNLPDIIFYICGVAIGGSGGGVYAASRSLMVRHTHPQRTTEAFGLFAFSGKATAFLAPALISLFSYILNDNRLGFAPVIVLFIIGMILLRWVNKDGDQNE